MDITEKLEYRSKLIRHLFLFCSSNQLDQFIHTQENLPLNERLSPDMLLKNLRNEVPFYKGSTLRAFFRITGFLIGIYILLNCSFAFPFHKFYSTELFFPPILFYAFAGLISAIVWQLINGKGLFKLFQRDLLSKKTTWGLILSHAVCFLFVCAAFGFITQDIFTSGEIYAIYGIDLTQAISFIEGTFFVANILTILLIVFSIIQVFRSSICYFTLTCHGLFMFALIFYTRIQFYDLSQTAADFSKALRLGVSTYLVLFVFALVLFLLISRFAQKRRPTLGKH